MGQHDAQSHGFGRRTRSLAIVVVVALVATGGWVVVSRALKTRAGAGGVCPVSLRAVTASSFAPVLATAARSLRTGVNCVQVDLQIIDGRSAAAQVAESHADLWIPDDASWVATMSGAALAPTGTTGSGTVLATSPIYQETDSATAQRLRSAGGTWLALATLLDQPGSGVRLVVRSPTGSGDGLVAAGAVGESVWLDRGMDASSLTLANALKVTRTVSQDLAATPEVTGEVGLVPEYALLPALTVTAADRVYLAAADRTAELRYTWLPSAEAAMDATREAALQRLLAAFRRPATVAAIAAAGLRGPDGKRPPSAGEQVLPPVTAKPFDVLAPHHVQHVFATWDPEDRRGNVLIVVDIASATPPSTSRSQSLDLLRQGCRTLVDLLPDGSRLGLWEVGAGLGGAESYRQVVPTARLDDGLRSTFTGAVGSLAVRKPSTGLFDATLDAYTTVRDDYQRDVVNQVIVFTDDQSGESADTTAVRNLAARLTAARDPAKPIELSVVVLNQPASADRLRGPLQPLDVYVDSVKGQEDIQATFIHVVAGGLHG